MHLRVDRYFRDAFIVSELIFCCSERPFACSFGFPRHAEQSTIRICHFFLPKATLESLLYSPGFQGYSNNLVPQLRIVAKRNNMLCHSPLANQVKSFPEIFSCGQRRMAVKVATRKCGVVHDIKEIQ